MSATGAKADIALTSRLPLSIVGGLLGENLSSTERWNDGPRGTMDEASSHVRLDLSSI
jgi:hypothetical protein